MDAATSVALRVTPVAKRMDIALVSGLVIFAAMEGLIRGVDGGERVVFCLGGVASAVPLTWRRGYCGPVAVAAVAPSAVAAMLGVPLEDLFGVLIALVIAFWPLGLYGSGRLLGMWALLSYLVLATSVIVAGHAAADLLYAGIIMALAVIPAHLLRRRLFEVSDLTAQAVRAEHEGQMRAQAAALEERDRVARELHDIIGHGVSLMVVHAAAAEAHLGDPVTAHRSLAAVQDVGRRAIADLARLLGLLRDDHAEIGLTPQPGVADLQDLAARARASGECVTLRITGATSIVDQALSLTVYRIVQEALTNARRHAPGAPVVADVAVRDRQITIDVRNARPTRTAELAGTGHGLRGVQERVRMFGGVLQYGHEADGGFALRATLHRDHGESMHQ